MVAFKGADANSEKNVEFSKIPYQRDNCRISGKNTKNPVSYTHLTLPTILLV